MICSKCNILMKSGTRYEREDEKSLTRRFHECKKCHNRIYTRKSNFQEYMSKVPKMCRNI